MANLFICWLLSNRMGILATLCNCILTIQTIVGEDTLHDLQHLSFLVVHGSCEELLLVCGQALSFVQLIL